MDGGAAYAEVCVAPWAEFFAEAEVFFADVEAAEECFGAVDDDDFTVVAEVDLETGPPEAVGTEGLAVDAGVFEFAEVGVGKFVGADFIEEEVNADPGFCFFDESSLEFTSDLVVFHDVEIDADIVFGGGEGGEDAVECLVAVDEQFELVSSGEGESAKFLGVALEDVFLGKVDGVFREGIAHIFGDFFEFGVVAAAGADVAAEFVTAEEPVKWYGEEGHEHEGNDPGDGALGGACVHQGVEDVKESEEIEGDDDGDAQPCGLFKMDFGHGVRMSKSLKV